MNEYTTDGRELKRVPICLCGHQDTTGQCAHVNPVHYSSYRNDPPMILRPPPRYHLLREGNYFSCNMYWVLGLDCPLCEKVKP